MNLRGVLLNWELFAGSPEAVPRLRELILQLAVQGKLVPQDPKDEPASELLKKIKAEKECLVKEGKIKRDKPLAEIEEEEKPFDLPVGWEWVRLGAIGYTNIGLTYSPKDVSDTGIPVLRSSNVQAGVLDFTDLKRVSMKVKDSVLVAEGDLLICARNGSKALVGKTAMITGLSEPMAFGAFMAIFRSDANDYVLYFINSPLFRRMISEVNTTTINQITQENLRGTAFPLPPLAEQSRIVTRVQELMKLCDALEAKVNLEAQQHDALLRTLLATLTQSASAEDLAQNWQRVSEHFPLLLNRPQAIDALEQTILQLAVRGLLVPQNAADEPASQLLKKIRTEKDKLIQEGKIKRDKPLPSIAEDEQPFELPNRWAWSRLEQLSLAIVDCPHSTPKFLERGRLCLDTNSFKQGNLLPHKLRYVDESTFIERNARLVPMSGDLVFAREGSVGESILVPEGVDACLGQRVMLFRFSECVSKEFVRLAISSTSFLESLLALHKGIGAKHVNVSDMRMAVVPLPPLPEQLRIVTRVTELRQLCAALRSRLAQSSQIQAQLAQALVQSSHD